MGDPNHRRQDITNGASSAGQNSATHHASDMGRVLALVQMGSEPRWHAHLALRLSVAPARQVAGPLDREIRGRDGEPEVFRHLSSRVSLLVALIPLRPGKRRLSTLISLWC